MSTDLILGPGGYHAHTTTEIELGSRIGRGTKIWRHAHIRQGARIGEDCIIGMGVVIDEDVVIGDRCKIQNYACIYKGVTIGKGVFIGPHVVFTNDLYPRAVHPETGEPLASDDWELVPTIVEDGVSIGANATIRCGVTLGVGSMIGAGSVVTHDTMAGMLYAGVPARPRPLPKARARYLTKGTR